LKREEPRDVFVSNHYASLAALPAGASVGTSSLRRQTQLRAIRSDLEYRMLRGNINTRLKRLDQGEYDALILAAAGLKRMDLAARIRSYLPITQSLPAAGQGALAIECRQQDAAVLSLIAPFNDEKSARCAQAERALCKQLGGGCKLPLAAFAEIQAGQMTLQGLVASWDGMKILRATVTGDPQHAEQIGIQVAEQLLAQGADQILKQYQ
jgi:hydroxymethylbilane synthase